MGVETDLLHREWFVCESMKLNALPLETFGVVTTDPLHHGSLLL